MKKKIIIVDDEPDILTSVKQLFEGMDEDYKVSCASSGIQCLKLLENNEIPDLILLDVMMPEMNGWETFDAIQKNQLWKNIPVVFFSAKSDNTAEKTGKFIGLDFIEKPFDIDDLKKKIDKVLKKSSSKGL